MEKEKILDKYYNSQHRYHTAKHVDQLLSLVPFHTETDLDRDILSKAVMFHDSVYDPRANDNEERSCEEFKKCFPGYATTDQVCSCIMATKDHVLGKGKLEDALITLDLHIFSMGMTALMAYEDGIFNEYQFVPIDEYITKRLDVLVNLTAKMSLSNRFTHQTLENMNVLQEYVRSRKYLVGIYPGSFNPFHIGHLNIVNQAETVCSKVVIAQGINPDKANSVLDIFSRRPMPSCLRNEIVTYTGLVTDLFKSQYENVKLVLVRGLRSVYDLGYEDNLRRVVKDIRPDINFMYFFCDPGLEHISSSQIRNLSKFNRKLADRYLVP